MVQRQERAMTSAEKAALLQELAQKKEQQEREQEQKASREEKVLSSAEVKNILDNIRVQKREKAMMEKKRRANQDIVTFDQFDEGDDAELTMAQAPAERPMVAASESTPTDPTKDIITFTEFDEEDLGTGANLELADNPAGEYGLEYEGPIETAAEQSTEVAASEENEPAGDLTLANIESTSDQDLVGYMENLQEDYSKMKAAWQEKVNVAAEALPDGVEIGTTMSAEEVTTHLESATDPQEIAVWQQLANSSERRSLLNLEETMQTVQEEVAKREQLKQAKEQALKSA